MKHLKTFESYTLTTLVPGPDVHGSKVLYLDDDEVSFFEEDEELIELLNKGKVNLLGNELWYFEKDEKMLRKIFPEII